MLEVRTNKAIKISLHTDEERKVVFKYLYRRTDNGMKFEVHPHSIVQEATEEEPEMLELMKGLSISPDMSFDIISGLLIGAKAIAVPDDNDVLAFDNLVSAGIKLYIVTEHLYRDQLTIADFE